MVVYLLMEPRDAWGWHPDLSPRSKETLLEVESHLFPFLWSCLGYKEFCSFQTSALKSFILSPSGIALAKDPGHSWGAFGGVLWKSWEEGNLLPWLSADLASCGMPAFPVWCPQICAWKQWGQGRHALRCFRVTSCKEKPSSWQDVLRGDKEG